MKDSDAASDERAHVAAVPPYPGTPRWVYGLVLVLIVAVLAFLVRHLAGGGFHAHAA